MTDPNRPLKLATNSMYGKLGNPGPGAVAMTPRYLARYLPKKAAAILMDPLEPFTGNRSIEEAVCLARDMLPEPSLIDLDQVRFPQAVRAAEIIVRTAMPGAYFEGEKLQVMKRADPGNYIWSALWVLNDSAVPVTHAFINNEAQYFISALNVWATREDEKLRIDVKAPWLAPYSMVTTVCSPEQFLGAIAAWPDRLGAIVKPRTLDESRAALAAELDALDRELKQMESK